MNNSSIVVPKSNNNKDKPDCFAWISKNKCNALGCKDCKNCKFYKPRCEVSDYDSRFISKTDLIERNKNLNEIRNKDVNVAV